MEVDVLVPSGRRRIWSAAEKAALLAEIDAEGGKVRLVARRRQISESLLYNSRSARKAAARSRCRTARASVLMRSSTRRHYRGCCVR